MNEDFVTYELAVKLKEKGFDEPCYGYYHWYGGNDCFELCGNGDRDFLNSKKRIQNRRSHHFPSLEVVEREEETTH